MQWCPLTKTDCKKECAWFIEGECVFERLHDIANQLEEIKDSVDDLKDTIGSISSSL